MIAAGIYDHTNVAFASFLYVSLPLDLKKKKQSISDKSVKISYEKSADLTYGTYNMYPSFLLINGQYICTLCRVILAVDY